jgi:hypothetical protein
MNKKIYFTLLLLGCFVVIGFKALDSSTDRITEIAKEYQQYKQFKDTKIIVTDSSKYNWIVVSCFVPNSSEAGYHYKIDSSFISKAHKTKSLHGNKLYRLFIKEYASYIRNDSIGQPIGQVIVKETWNVKEIAYDSINLKVQQIRSQNDGKWYTPTTVSELFVMYKEKESSNNDKGWNYGMYSIEDPNRKPVLLNDMNISSCISCHRETKYDRIFGVK